MEDLIEHKIVIDKYLSATLMIPRELNIVTLQAIMKKTNKMFSLASDDFLDGTTVQVTQGTTVQDTPNVSKQTSVKKNRNHGNGLSNPALSWNDEACAFLKNEIKDKGRDKHEVFEEFKTKWPQYSSINYKQFDNKFNYFKRNKNNWESL